MRTRELPKIDFTHLFSTDIKKLKVIADEIADAYSQYGFASINNAPLSEEMRENLFHASHLFHALPVEEKMKVKSGATLRGWIPPNVYKFNTSSVDGTMKKNNLNTSFVIMAEHTEDHPGFSTFIGGRNQWPENLPFFKRVASEYFDHMMRTSRQLVRIISLALGHELDFLNNLFTDPGATLRLLCYPPHPVDAESDLFGIAPHTDYSFFTLLIQDEIGGLQVKSTEDGWIDVPYEPNSIVMNAGNMLQLLSNGHFMSTPHRVLNNSTQKERFSCAFFFDPNFSAEIKPLANLGDPKFKSVIFGEYLLDTLKRNYKL